MAPCKIIQQDRKSLVKNCRVYNSADIRSDHSLILSKIKIPTMRNRKIKPKQKKFDVDKPNDKKLATELEIKIGGRFEPLFSLDADIDEIYEKFKTTTNGVTKEVVAFKRHKLVQGTRNS